MATNTKMEQLADQIVAAMRTFITRTLAPHVATQRDLIARADKLAERVAVLEHRLAIVERKAGD